MYYNYKNDIAKLDKNIMKMNIPLLSKIWKRYKKFDSGIITAYCNKNTEKENYEKNYNQEGNCQEKRIRF